MDQKESQIKISIMAMDERDQVVRALQAKFVLLKSYYIPIIKFIHLIKCDKA